jgi:hypothetical protein
MFSFLARSSISNNTTLSPSAHALWGQGEAAFVKHIDRSLVPRFLGDWGHRPCSLGIAFPYFGDIVPLFGEPLRVSATAAIRIVDVKSRAIVSHRHDRKLMPQNQSLVYLRSRAVM